MHESQTTEDVLLFNAQIVLFLAQVGLTVLWLQVYFLHSLSILLNLTNYSWKLIEINFNSEAKKAFLKTQF